MLNNIETQMTKCSCFELRISVIWVCLGFRYWDLESTGGGAVAGEAEASRYMFGSGILFLRHGTMDGDAGRTVALLLERTW